MREKKICIQTVMFNNNLVPIMQNKYKMMYSFFYFFNAKDYNII